MNKEAQANLPLNFGDLPSYIGYQVRQAQAAVFRDFRRITAETGLTPGEFSLLALVDGNPNINMVSLVAIYQLNKSTLSLTVDKLIRRGLIDRARQENDRRYYSLFLTPKGRQALDLTRKRVEEQERVMDTVLRPGERDLLIDILKRVTGSLS